jgi:hypothetical protein
MKLQTMRGTIDPCEHCCPLETETDKFPFREIPVSSERDLTGSWEHTSSYCAALDIQLYIYVQSYEIKDMLFYN